MFRYFAKIVAKDPKIDEGICHIDACILRITTRMEEDVGGNGEGCGDQIEHLLLNNPHAVKQEKLHPLKITDKCELDEQVRIVGYNQGGEGLLGHDVVEVVHADGAVAVGVRPVDHLLQLLIRHRLDRFISDNIRAWGFSIF